MTEPVVIAEKMFFRGALHASTAYGGSTLPVSHGIALKFVAVNDKIMTIQVLHSGIGEPIKNQTWFKPKTTTRQPKRKESKVTFTNAVEQQELI